MKTRGLLLISDRGDAYFIESGIKANRNTEVDWRTVGGAAITLSKDTLSPNAALRQNIEIWRAQWAKDLQLPCSDLSSNAGPVLLMAYSVEVEREDYGDATVTGNASNLDVF